MIWFVKKWVKKISPFALSRNHWYDILSGKIIRKHCTAESNCIDVGCHEGEVLDQFLKHSPKGIHFAFEPIPGLYKKLLARYGHFTNCRIFNYAISNEEAMALFNHVITNPAYSGIKKRKYDRRNERDETISVSLKKLDDIIPLNLKIDFIKIDVEGGEFDVMTGAERLIKRSKPLIVFEFGVGGSDVYEASPEKMYEFMKHLNYKISLLDHFLKNKSPLSPEEFCKQFYGMKNYYFIASPGD